jgi:hypothetical protein
MLGGFLAVGKVCSGFYDGEHPPTRTELPAAGGSGFNIGVDNSVFGSECGGCN